MSEVATWSRTASVAPLVARGALLIACSLLAALAYGPRLILGPALLLLGVAALASLPLPYAPPMAQPAAELVLAALLLGAVGERGTPFLPYLIVPAVVVGLAQGVRSALAITLAGGAVLLTSGAAIAAPGADARETVVQQLQWSLLACAVAMLTGLARNVRRGDVASPEPAYLEAHRLLSELHVVARQLSLGLDPATLALALCDDLEPVTGSADNVVLVRGQTGQYHRLTGSGALPVRDVDLDEAWTSSAPVLTAANGISHLVLPVRMGERVVALAVSSFDSTASASAHLTAVAARVVDRSGSRLASAMLFDEVRSLATQDERLRLARDIHDGIAQDVASLGFFVDDAMHGADESTAAKLTVLRGELRRIVSELRLSIFDLRIGADGTVTVGISIGEHVRRVGSQAGLTVHVTVEESDSRLTAVAEHDLMRVAQEAMTNVRRHAQASTVWVECRVDAPSFLLRIADDGRGLGPSTDASMGLKGIRERSARLGGTLHVGDRPGGGTVVEIRRAEPTNPKETMKTQARHG